MAILFLEAITFGWVILVSQLEETEEFTSYLHGCPIITFLSVSFITYLFFPLYFGFNYSFSLSVLKDHIFMLAALGVGVGVVFFLFSFLPYVGDFFARSNIGMFLIAVIVFRLVFDGMLNMLEFPGSPSYPNIWVFLVFVLIFIVVEKILLFILVVSFSVVDFRNIIFETPRIIIDILIGGIGWMLPFFMYTQYVVQSLK